MSGNPPRSDLLKCSFFCKFSAPRLISDVCSCFSRFKWYVQLEIAHFPAWAVRLTGKKVSDCVGSVQCPFHSITASLNVLGTLTSHSRGVKVLQPHQRKNEAWCRMFFLSFSSLSVSLSHLSFTLLSLQSIIFSPTYRHLHLHVHTEQLDASPSGCSHPFLPNEWITYLSDEPKLCLGLRWLCINR